MTAYGVRLALWIGIGLIRSPSSEAAPDPVNHLVVAGAEDLSNLLSWHSTLEEGDRGEPDPLSASGRPSKSLLVLPHERFHSHLTC